MKKIQISIIGLGLLLSACAPMKQLAQSLPGAPAEAGVANNMPLSSGTYFIVNANSNQALTPLNQSVGENVFLRDFNHGGLQRWQVIRVPNTTTYSIKLAGTDAMFFQPNYVKDHTPMVSPGKNGTSFKIQAAQGTPDSWLIKSLKFNGDALHSFVFSPNLPTELRFDPTDGSRKFMWRFIKVRE